MALLSTKGIYGLMAMYELHQHQKTSEKPIGLKEIAKKTEISSGYLEQLFSMLKREGLIQSIRGSKGGYKLSKNRKITIKNILIALEGEISMVSNDTDNPLFDLFFRDCNLKIEKILDIPLSQLDEYRQLLTDRIEFSI